MPLPQGNSSLPPNAVDDRTPAGPYIDPIFKQKHRTSGGIVQYSIHWLVQDL